MNSVDVIWFIEHIAREFDVACAVKAILQKKGVSVKVVPLWHVDFRRLTRQYKPKVVVVPHAYGIQWGFLPRYLPAWRDAVFFNAAWEQMYEKAYHDIKRQSDVFVREHVVHHAWGDFFKTYLLENGVPEEGVFLNGHPAYRLYREPYRQVFKDRESLAREFGLNPSKRWIFFPETYSWAFREQHWIKTQQGWGIDLQLIEEMQKFCVDSLQIVLGWLIRLAQAGDVEIIIRPRPTTSRAVFVQFSKTVQDEFPRSIHFIQNYSVREWILASDTIISSHSTSLIEGAVAGKPTYMVQPIPLPQPMSSEWMQYPQVISHEDEFQHHAMGTRLDETRQNRFNAWVANAFPQTQDAIWSLAEYLRGAAGQSFQQVNPISEEQLKDLIPGDVSTWRASRGMPLLKRLYRDASRALELAQRRATARRNGTLRDYFTERDVIQRTRVFSTVLFQKESQ